VNQEKLKELLHYDPETGVWTWLKPKKACFIGKRCGAICSSGYRQIKIGGIAYCSSRLACLYMTGEWPKDTMDHINRIKDDDRWVNLREATRSQNNYNRVYGDMRGIWRQHHRWRVKVGVNNYLGSYQTICEAKQVRDLALSERAGAFVERTIS
jgi:hypothetical protein